MYCTGNARKKGKARAHRYVRRVVHSHGYMQSGAGEGEGEGEGALRAPEGKALGRAGAGRQLQQCQVQGLHRKESHIHCRIRPGLRRSSR